jgi:hypothetical protein
MSKSGRPIALVAISGHNTRELGVITGFAADWL